MKKYLSILFVVQILFVCAQVGVNTEDPQTTLDVVASPDDASLADGITAPRVTGQQLKAKDGLYETPETGAIVFVTEALEYDDPEVEEDPAIDPAVATTTKTQLVTGVGYYYFDGTIWRPFHKEPWNVINTTEEATSVDEDIYHLRNVAIGSTSANSAKLTLFSNRDIDTETRYGLRSIIFDDDNSILNGYSSTFISNGDTPVEGSDIFGMNVTVSDGATFQRSSTAGSFTLLAGQATERPESFYNGLNVNTEFQDGNTDRSYKMKYVKAIQSSLALGGAGNFEVLEKAIGIDSKVVISSGGNIDLNTASTNEYTTAGQFFTQISPKQGTYNIDRVYGSTSILEFSKGVNTTSPIPGGLADVSEAASLRASTRFDINEATTIDVENIYGILVDTDFDINIGTFNIPNAYGLYIRDYNFDYTNATSAFDTDFYNFFSAGESAKNVFEGRVGVGTNTPGAKVHIIKEADASVLTPVIIEGLPVFEDDDAASSLPSGALYKSSDGILRVKN